MHMARWMPPAGRAGTDIGVRQDPGSARGLRSLRGPDALCSALQPKDAQIASPIAELMADPDFT